MSGQVDPRLHRARPTGGITTRPLPYSSLEDAAEYAGVSVKTIRRRIAEGSLTGYRVGKRLVRVDLNELNQALRAEREAPRVGRDTSDLAKRHKAIGAACLRMREKLGLSQAATADAMRSAGHGKWSQATVWSVEKGDRPLRLTEAEDLARIFGAAIEELFQ